jgi:hypothetical protein
MRAERELEAGLAVTIALAIIPMGWLAYLTLALILAALVVRIIWISLPKRWERWAASVAALALLAALVGPDMLTRLGGG